MTVTVARFVALDSEDRGQFTTIRTQGDEPFTDEVIDREIQRLEKEKASVGEIVVGVENRAATSSFQEPLA